MIRFAGKTHQGKRPYNEDCFLVDGDRGLVIVADGMGGHEAGEVASKLATHVISDCLASNGDLVDAIMAAHRELIKAAHDGRGKPGMGTTIAVARFVGRDYVISWVGDSRVYLWNGKLLQLTRDHSYIEALMSTGLMSREEAAASTQRNLVTQALGVEAINALDVKVLSGSLGSGEQLLLCSDGLNDELTGQQIAAILRMDLPLEDKVDELVAAAIVAGGRDNVTVALVELESQKTALVGRAPPSPVSVIADDGSETYRSPDPEKKDFPVNSVDDAENRAMLYAGQEDGEVALKRETEQGSTCTFFWLASVGLIIVGVVAVNFLR